MLEKCDRAVPDVSIPSTNPITKGSCWQQQVCCCAFAGSQAHNHSAGGKVMQLLCDFKHSQLEGLGGPANTAPTAIRQQLLQACGNVEAKCISRSAQRRTANPQNSTTNTNTSSSSSHARSYLQVPCDAGKALCLPWHSTRRRPLLLCCCYHICQRLGPKRITCNGATRHRCRRRHCSCCCSRRHCCSSGRSCQLLLPRRLLHPLLLHLRW